MRVTDMDTKTEIKEAEAAVDAAHQAYVAAQRRRDELYRRRSREDYGIDVGLTVRDPKGRVGVVAEVKPNSWPSSRPWLYVALLRKDGTPGDRVTTFYDGWEIVQPQS
jgi:hypothetical protein